MEGDEFLPATPGCSMSTRWGWNMHSGASKRSEPTLMVRPSGSWVVVSLHCGLDNIKKILTV